MRINFIIDNIINYIIEDKSGIEKIINRICDDHKREIDSIEIIVTSDERLREISKKFLKKDHYTDVIAFNYAEDESKIESEIYISLERVRENAKKFGESIENELRRMIIHGILHLNGYNDNIDDKHLIMRNKEDYYLNNVPRETF